MPSNRDQTAKKKLVKRQEAFKAISVGKGGAKAGTSGRRMPGSTNSHK